MRRKVLVLILMILGTGALYAWFELRNPGLPLGVSKEEWTPITSDLGLVVKDVSDGKSRGYLVRRVDGQWEHVGLVDPDAMGFLPAR